MSDFSSRVTAGSADVLLLVESGLTTSTAKSVGLGLSETERGSTFSLDLQGNEGKKGDEELPFVILINLNYFIDDFCFY